MKAQELLPDNINEGEFNGALVCKGTVGAFLINATVWLDESATRAQRQQAELDIIEALPALQALGLYEILKVRDIRPQQIISAP